MKEKIKNYKKAFTLVELLVVISIIGVLSSIVFASLGGAKDKAKQSAFRQQMDEFLKAVEMARNSSGQAPRTSILRYSVGHIGKYGNPDGFYDDTHQNNFNTVFKNPGYISEFPRLWKPSSSYGYVYYVPFTSGSCGNQTGGGANSAKSWIYIRSYNSTQKNELNALFPNWDISNYALPCKILN